MEYCRRFISDCGRICGIHETQGVETDLLKGFHKKALVKALFSLFSII
jgi:hypothetical protein